MVETRGPEVPDHEDALRAILAPTFWVEEEMRPSSALFNKAKFSVDIASRTTPAKTASRFQGLAKIVQFNCGKAREIDFDTRDEPDPEHPENDAHAHVYFDGSGNKRKKRARRLVDLCDVIDLDNF